MKCGGIKRGVRGETRITRFDCSGYLRNRGFSSSQDVESTESIATRDSHGLAGLCVCTFVQLLNRAYVFWSSSDLLIIDQIVRVTAGRDDNNLKARHSRDKKSSPRYQDTPNTVQPA